MRWGKKKRLVVFTSSIFLLLFLYLNVGLSTASTSSSSSWDDRRRKRKQGDKKHEEDDDGTDSNNNNNKKKKQKSTSSSSTATATTTLMLERLENDVKYVHDALEVHRNQFYKDLEYHRNQFLMDVKATKAYIYESKTYLKSKIKSQIDNDLQQLHHKLEQAKNEIQCGAQNIQENALKAMEQIQNDIDELQDELLELTYQIQNDIECASKQVWEDIENLHDAFHKVWLDYKIWGNTQLRQVYKTIRKTSRKYKARFVKSIFKQRIGFDRFIHSLRNHFGLLLGIIVAFRGNSLKESIFHFGVPLELAMFSWDFFDDRIIPPSSKKQKQYYQPWINDILSSMVGCTIVTIWNNNNQGKNNINNNGIETASSSRRMDKQRQQIFQLLGFQKKIEQPPRQHRLYFKNIKDVSTSTIPATFVFYWLFYFCGIVIDEWGDNEIIELIWSGGRARVLWSMISSFIVSTSAIKIANIPSTIIASSIAGSLLIVDSWRAEVAGNWFYMMQTVLSILFKFGPPLRKVRKRIRELWKLLNFLKDFEMPILLQQIKDKIIVCYNNIQKLVSFIVHPFDVMKTFVVDHPAAKRVLKFLERLKKALSPIMWPVTLSIWGIGIQMGNITGIGSVWTTFRLSMDPVSFVLGRLSRIFDAKVQFRHVLVKCIRTCLSGINRNSGKQQQSNIKNNNNNNNNNMLQPKTKK